MKLGTWMMINGLFGFALGGALIWFTPIVLGLLAAELNDAGQLLVRVLGAGLLAYGVATAAAGSADEGGQAQKVVATGRLVSEILATLILLLALFGGGLPTAAWVLFGLHLAFAVGYLVLGVPVLRRATAAA
jgi:hypothetical protein